MTNRMDLREDPNANAVTAVFEMPGLTKEDVHIDVQNNRLTVSGESKASSDREEDGWVIRERTRGGFSRTLQLPAGVKVRVYDVGMSTKGLLTRF
jgi:HSP20 family protein